MVVLLFGILASTCVMCHVSQIVAMFSSVKFSQYVLFSLVNSTLHCPNLCRALQMVPSQLQFLFALPSCGTNFAKTRTCFVSTMMW